MVRTVSPAPLWRFLWIGLTLLILWLSLLPSDSVPSGLGWDKLNHVAAIAVMTGIAFLALRPRRRAAEAAFLYGACLGILIEILQAALTTTRAAEWSDVLADLIGAGLAWGVIRIFRLKQRGAA